ncbi:MAG: hypothetical protein KJ749_10465, partial [Planctomycetes bacterium]|nr:hypothetical protein [Planctomycetota bacterium]
MKKMLVALKTPSNVLLLAHSQIVGYILAFTVLVFPPAAWAQVPRVEEPLEAIPVVVIPGLNTPEDDLLEEALSGAFTLEMAQWINEHPQVDIFNYVWQDHDPTKDAIFLTNTGDSWSVELVDSTVVPDEGNSHIVFSGEFQFVNRFPLENYEPSAQRESTEIIAGWIIDTGAEPMPSKLVIGMLLSLPFVDDAGVETIIHSLMLMGWDNNSSRAEK